MSAKQGSFASPRNTTNTDRNSLGNHSRVLAHTILASARRIVPSSTKFRPVLIRPFSRSYITVKRRRPVRSFRELEGDSHEGLLLAALSLSYQAGDGQRLTLKCAYESGSDSDLDSSLFATLELGEIKIIQSKIEA